jgi:hypothetical protein
MADGLHVVTLHDVRYGRPLDSLDSIWPLVVVFDDAGNLLHAARARRYRRESFGKLVAETWSDIFSP